MRQRTVLLQHFLEDSEQTDRFAEELSLNLEAQGIRLVVMCDVSAYADKNYIAIPFIQPFNAVAKYDHPWPRERCAHLNRVQKNWKRSEYSQGVWAELDGFYETFLSLLEPGLHVLWNGEHAAHHLIRSHARSSIVFLERAPFKGALQFDKRGILADCSTADTDISDTPPFPQAGLQALRHFSSWHMQPTQLQELPDPCGRRKVLFLGQVEDDTQRFLYSDFESTLHGFREFLGHIRPFRDTVYILGKAHPASAEDENAYLREIESEGFQGTWSSEFPLEACLQWSDLVATVNSGSIYESLLREKVPLCLGRHIMSKQAICYSNQEIDVWAEQESKKDRIDRFHRFLTAMSDSIFGISPDSVRVFGDASKLASLIAKEAVSTKSNLDAALHFFDLQVECWNHRAFHSRLQHSRLYNCLARYKRFHRSDSMVRIHGPQVPIQDF